MKNGETKIRGRLFCDNHDVAITVADGKISKIELIPDSSFSDGGVYIAPGFIDNQVNGCLGVDFSEPDLTVEQIRKVTKKLWEKGVTCYLPTLITSADATIKANLAILAEAMRDKEIGPSIPGIHLEGPYISREDGYRGAHNKKWIREPDWNEFVSYCKAAEDHILHLTLAPELTGGVEFIRKASENEITVALGHHNADSETIRRAIYAGAKSSTHLGNGCANLINRHHNPLWPQLASDCLSASLIADGFHLRPEEIYTFYKAKGRENIVLISDITKVAGLPAGRYKWNEDWITLTEEGMIKYEAQDVLAGSASMLDEGIANMMRFCNGSLADVIPMVTENPARLNNLNDRGRIEVGKRADFVLLNWNGNELSIKETIIKGETVYKIA